MCRALGVIENHSIDVDYIDQRLSAPRPLQNGFQVGNSSAEGEKEGLRRIKLDLVLKWQIRGKWLVKEAIRIITLRLPQRPKLWFEAECRMSRKRVYDNGKVELSQQILGDTNFHRWTGAFNGRKFWSGSASTLTNTRPHPRPRNHGALSSWALSASHKWNVPRDGDLGQYLRHRISPVIRRNVQPAGYGV